MTLLKNGTFTAEDNTILVYGILGLSKDALELFFENSKRCDGGDIEDIVVNEEDDTALISYKDATGVFINTTTVVMKDDLHLVLFVYLLPKQTKSHLYLV